MGQQKTGRGAGTGRLLKKLLVAAGFMLFRAVVLVIPRSWDERSARTIKRLVLAFSPHLRRRALDHLRLVYDGTKSPAERRAIAEEALLNFARMLVEFFRLLQLDATDVRRLVRVNGQGNLRRALDAKRGIIALTGHYGNYEMMAANCGVYGLPFLAIARSKADEFVEPFLADVRDRHGLEIVHKFGWRVAAERLKEGGLVGVVADQAVRTGGVLVEFLGHNSPTAIGPLLLARHSNATVLPMFITRDANNRFTLDIHPPLDLPNTGDEEQDLRDGALLLNQTIGSQVLHRPEEWLWVHRRWKKPVAVRRSSPKLSRAFGEMPDHGDDGDDD